MRRTKFMWFSLICGFTLLLIVLCVQLDLTSTHLLKISSRHLVAPIKKTTISAMDATGALHVRRRVLHKVDASRAAELGLGVYSWNHTSSAPQPVDEGITLPKNRKTQIVKVMLERGTLAERIVPPGKGKVARPVPGIPGQTGDEDTGVPYYDSVYEAVEGEKDGESEGVDADSIALSQAQDIAIRGKWQKEQVKKFCRKYGSEEAGNTLPRPKSDARLNLLRHLLFDDSRKLLFCFLPKVGCTNMRRLMFVLSGTIPVETITWDRVPEIKYLGPGVQQGSLVNPYLSDVERLEKVEAYWKFVVLRNPLERLVSAFRNKLEAPLNISEIYSQTFQMISRSIVETYHPRRFRYWKARNGTGTLKVDFHTYIRWIVDRPNEKLNEHFCPMVHLSQPCRLQYDFYGHFAHLSTDINLVLKKYQIPANYFHDEGYYQTGEETSTLLHKYYSTVSPEVKLALFKDFYIDLDYYYHLFPADRNSHVQLLGVNQTVQ